MGRGNGGESFKGGSLKETEGGKKMLSQYRDYIKINIHISNTKVAITDIFRVSIKHKLKRETPIEKRNIVAKSIDTANGAESIRSRDCELFFYKGEKSDELLYWIGNGWVEFEDKNLERSWNKIFPPKNESDVVDSGSNDLKSRQKGHHEQVIWNGTKLEKKAYREIELILDDPVSPYKIFTSKGITLNNKKIIDSLREEDSGFQDIPYRRLAQHLSIIKGKIIQSKSSTNSPE